MCFLFLSTLVINCLIFILWLLRRVVYAQTENMLNTFCHDDDDDVDSENETMHGVNQKFENKTEGDSCDFVFRDVTGRPWTKPINRLVVRTPRQSHVGTSNSWMVYFMENPLKIDDLGYPYLGKLHMKFGSFGHSEFLTTDLIRFGRFRRRPVSSARTLEDEEMVWNMLVGWWSETIHINILTKTGD